MDDDTPNTWELIEILKMVCPCGECDGVWLTRHEADALISELKGKLVSSS